MDIDIDINSLKADVVFDECRNYMLSIGGELVHVGTYRKETTKSAIQTACRGLDINPDIGMYLSSLIPTDRGTVRSLENVVFGNEELGYEPIAEFVREVNKHPNLYEAIKGIEGLINGRGIHAGGVVAHMDIIDCTALMKSKDGSTTTQYSLEDVEASGGVKLDLK